MPVSRQPPKIKVQLSPFLLPSSKIQTEPEYHLTGKILPLSNTWLQGCPVVCSQVQCRKSKAKIFQPQGKAGRNHSTAWPLQEELLRSVTAKAPAWAEPCRDAASAWQGGAWDTAGTLSGSSKAFRPPRLLVMHSVIQLKLSELAIHVKPVLDEHSWTSGLSAL